MGSVSCRPMRHGSARGRGSNTAVAVLLLLLTPASVAAQVNRPPDGVVSGRVIDQADGKPISAAEVGLDGARVLAVTDDEGGFRIAGVPGGGHVLWVRRLGYRERSDSLVVPPRALLDVTVALSEEAIELDELVVVVRSPVLTRHGFYSRQEQGYGGHFIDRAAIEDRNPSSVSDLFRDVPGLRVVYGGIYGGRVFINQRATFADDGRPGCEPLLWLDGIRSTMNSYDLMRAEEIEGIEVYAGGSAPGKFVDICGTVVIWTRVPIG